MTVHSDSVFKPPTVAADVTLTGAGQEGTLASVDALKSHG